MGAKGARRILKYASKACPVVGGVMRSPPHFGGSRPNDTPDKSGSDEQSDGDDVGGAGASDTEPEKTPSASDGDRQHVARVVGRRRSVIPYADSRGGGAGRANPEGRSGPIACIGHRL